MEKLCVQILDLTCASCVPSIEQVMRQQEGVIWAIVNFAAEEATILYDPDVFSLSQLVAAVSQLGYQVTPSDKPAKHSSTTHNAQRLFVWMQQWVRIQHDAFWIGAGAKESVMKSLRKEQYETHQP